MANAICSNPTLFILIALVSTSASLGQASLGVGDNAGQGSARTVPEMGAQTAPESHPNLPTVVCNGTQLTITTNNSTLASVLDEVHKCIGAKIDMPDGAATSRVFDKLGPGPAREVLSSLLTATGFDYVIGLSESNPAKVETVLLMARAIDTSSGASADNALSPARRAYLQMRQNGRSGAPPAESSHPDVTPEPDAAAKDNTASVPADSAATNPNQPPTSDQAPTAVDGVPVPHEMSNPTPPSSSSSPGQSSDTREQITNMEKLFEQRRQMMQNQNTQLPK